MKKLIATILLFGPMAMAAPKKVITLTDRNFILLAGEVTPKSTSDVFEEAKKMDSEVQSNDPIYLFLNTPGGNIVSGVKLIDNLQGLNHKVHTISINAFSMGFQIMQGLGDRYLTNNSIIMSHEAYGGFEGSFSHGKSQLDSFYGLWLEKIKEMDLITVGRTKGKQTLESYRKAYSKDLWLTAAQAVAGGYADEIVVVQCSRSLSGTWEEIVPVFGFSIKVTWSKCPLNGFPLAVEPIFDTNKGSMTLKEFQSGGGINGYDAHPYSEVEPTPALYTTTPLDFKEMTKAAATLSEKIINERSGKQVIRN